MRFLLDTNILSEVGKKRPNGKVMNWLLAHEMDSAVPSIVLSERYQGAHGAPIELRQRLLAELDFLVKTDPERIVPFDADAARVWGDYVMSPEMLRYPKSWPDTQIAAIALSRGLTVVTRNIEDFPGIPVVNPFEDQ